MHVHFTSQTLYHLLVEVVGPRAISIRTPFREQLYHVPRSPARHIRARGVDAAGHMQMLKAAAGQAANENEPVAVGVISVNTSVEWTDDPPRRKRKSVSPDTNERMTRKTKHGSLDRTSYNVRHPRAVYRLPM